MSGTRTSGRGAQRPLAGLALALTMTCRSAPAGPPQLATARVTVNNPLYQPVRVYQIYQTRPTFDPRLRSALCEPLGEVAARDSARFIITAGATDFIGVVFQADSLNGMPAAVSRAMQARRDDELRWTVARDTRLASPPRPQPPQRGVIPSPPVEADPSTRTRDRC